MMKKEFFLGLLAFSFPVLSIGQDTTDVREFDEVKIERNRIFKRIGLYDSYEVDNTPSILGFTQLTIFDNQMSNEVWSSPVNSCVEYDLIKGEKATYLDVSWNKDQEGCDWVGLGFGWDFWSSKDMGQIIAISALEIEVRSKGKVMGNLPWALGFEDYAGGQAWTGFSANFVPNGQITSEWTKVQIPLALFPFEEFDCDPSNIKQLIIQLFAQDAVEINAIRIVPFEGKLRQEIESYPLANQSVQLDGRLKEWKKDFTKIDSDHSFAVMNTNDSLFVAVKVKDDSPRLNNKTKGSLWNGDAIEIAFSTNSRANPKRKLFLLSDYHIGLNCGPTPYLWNFSEETPFEQGKFAIQNTSDGYTVEIAIALKELTKRDIIDLASIGFEIAIDKGDDTLNRNAQVRWNSSSSEGFHTNPSLWGTLFLK